MDIKSKINEIQQSFYEENKKHIFLNKNKQKQVLAESVCDKIEISDMLRHTTWIIPYTNKIYFDYHMFKLYATPNNYYLIISEILKLCSQAISTNGSFSVHVNFAGFTISAADRYRSVIELFCNECLLQNHHFSIYLESMNIYNTPHFIDSLSGIVSGLIPVEVKRKIRKYDKRESEELLNLLFMHNHHHGSVNAASTQSRQQVYDSV